MKLITSLNSVKGFKILLAAEYLKVNLDLEISPVEKSILSISEDCQLFSSNSAVWYLFSSNDSKSNNSRLDKWIDWETTILQLEVQNFLVKVPHNLDNVLDHLEKALHCQYVFGV